MADYKGNTCPVCKQKFKEADDIVVCPDCGTPYHRECWKMGGVCVHQADHAAGFEWTPDNVISDRPDDIVCPNCGEKHYIFGKSNLEQVAKDLDVKVLAQIPMDPAMATAMDQGAVESLEKNYLEPVADAILAHENR